MSESIEHKKRHAGEFFILSQAVLWSFFPVISKLTLNTLSPFFTAAISVGIAAIFFALVLTVRGEWRELLIRRAWLPMLIATFGIGVAFYGLFILGIKHTTAGNAGIMALMEIFFTIVILGLLKKERLSRREILAASFMVFGAVLVLFPGRVTFYSGDFIILIATAIPPLCNYAAQQARKYVGAMTIMFVRSSISAVFLLGIAFFFEATPTQDALTQSFFVLFLNGFFIMALSKYLWIEGIHRMHISRALTFSAIAPAFTIIFAYFILSEVPRPEQFAGLVPMLVGAFMLLRKSGLEHS